MPPLLFSPNLSQYIAAGCDSRLGADYVTAGSTVSGNAPVRLVVIPQVLMPSGWPCWEDSLAMRRCPEFRRVGHKAIFFSQNDLGMWSRPCSSIVRDTGLHCHAWSRTGY